MGRPVFLGQVALVLTAYVGVLVLTKELTRNDLAFLRGLVRRKAGR